jgi:hypothetical protein
VKDYVKRYSPKHVLVFDEAQRAFDVDKMRESHKNAHSRSEPEECISFADRIPEWCVVVGLIGSGQEIHVGEEAGLRNGVLRLRARRRRASGPFTFRRPLPAYLKAALYRSN